MSHALSGGSRRNRQIGEPRDMIAAVYRRQRNTVALFSLTRGAAYDVRFGDSFLDCQNEIVDWMVQRQKIQLAPPSLCKLPSPVQPYYQQKRRLQGSTPGAEALVHPHRPVYRLRVLPDINRCYRTHDMVAWQEFDCTPLEQ